MTDYNYLIRQLMNKKEYRPVVVALLYNKKNEINRFLAVQSAKALTNDGIEEWLFPQEGIEEDETLEKTLARGLHEELSMLHFHYQIHNPNEPIFLYKTVDAEKGRADKRGYTKGKAYLHVLARYHGNGDLIVNPKEIVKADWYTAEELRSKFSQGRKEKADLLIEGLDYALIELAQEKE